MSNGFEYHDRGGAVFSGFGVAALHVLKAPTALLAISLYAVFVGGDPKLIEIKSISQTF